LLASLKLGYGIAKCRKCYSIREKLLLPAANDVVEKCLVNNKPGKTLENST
jgi:hypothetical protein